MKIGSKWIWGVVLAGLSLIARADSAADGCERCQLVLADIQYQLADRCDRSVTKEYLRQQPIYLFLSIFDEVSQGVAQSMRDRVYQAALSGIECDNPNAGVKAAQREANRLMVQNRT